MNTNEHTISVDTTVTNKSEIEIVWKYSTPKYGDAVKVSAGASVTMIGCHTILPITNLGESDAGIELFHTSFEEKDIICNAKRMAHDIIWDGSEMTETKTPKGAVL